jgi:NTE family protein
LVNPLTWPQTLSGGFGRSELAADYYDQILFHGATFGDLLGKRAPVAIVGSTDITTGAQILFSQRQFDVLCADLARFPLSRAAAASSAVPVIMSPVTLDNRAGRCGYRMPPWLAAALDEPFDKWPPQRIGFRARAMRELANSAERPFVHLVDGGVADNLGIYAIVVALDDAQLMSKLRADAGLDRFKRIAIVIVNARSDPSFQWDRQPVGPGTLELLMQSVSLPIDRYSNASITALADAITEWELRVKLRQLDPRAAGSVPGVRFYVSQIGFAGVTDADARTYLQNLPTTLALPSEAIDRLRAAGAQLLRDSPAFKQLVRDLGVEADNPRTGTPELGSGRPPAP